MELIDLVTQGPFSNRSIPSHIKLILFAGRTNMVPDTKTVPLGLRKMKQYGLRNVILETDISDGCFNFNAFPLEEYCTLVKKWIIWAHDNLDETAKVFVNVRDLKDTMPTHSKRCFQYVEFLAKLPPKIRPIGLMFEEPGGGVLPEEVGNWARFIRKVMNRNKWKGHLLVHVHEKFGFADSTALHVRK